MFFDPSKPQNRWKPSLNFSEGAQKVDPLFGHFVSLFGHFWPFFTTFWAIFDPLFDPLLSRYRPKLLCVQGVSCQKGVKKGVWFRPPFWQVLTTFWAIFDPFLTPFLSRYGPKYHGHAKENGPKGVKKGVPKWPQKVTPFWAKSGQKWPFFDPFWPVPEPQFTLF